MHPSPDFRANAPDLAQMFVREIGFAALFAATPDGPRVAHSPILLNDAGTHIRFHIARGNALARHIADAPMLAVVQGPDAYVSANYYGDDQQVPTWNYIAIEMEGMPQQLDDAGLHDLLVDIAAIEDGRAQAGPPWTRERLAPALYDRLFGAIYGFEMRIIAWRPTFKLSQNKSPDERERIAAALDQRGHHAMTQWMRHFGSNRKSHDPTV